MIMTPANENVDGVFDDIFNFGNEKSTASDGQFSVCQKAKLVNIYSQLVWCDFGGASVISEHQKEKQSHIR